MCVRYRGFRGCVTPFVSEIPMASSGHAPGYAEQLPTFSNHDNKFVYPENFLLSRDGQRAHVDNLFLLRTLRYARPIKISRESIVHRPLLLRKLCSNAYAVLLFRIVRPFPPLNPKLCAASKFWLHNIGQMVPWHSTRSLRRKV